MSEQTAVGPHSLRERLEQASLTVGTWCILPTPLTVELVARLRFDFLCIDTQHGPIGYEQLVGMLQVANTVGCPALVRVASHERSELMHALDAGAQGVVVPMVDDAAEARRLVSACRYPPDGERSWGPYRPVLGAPALSAEEANGRIAVILMIETREGLRNAEEIAAVPGVDGLLIGPSDLAITHDTSAGADEHTSLIRQVLAAGAGHGVAVGNVCGDLESARRWAGEGMRFVTVGSDLGWLATGANADAAAARSVLPWTA
jgi:4-hydroxy-2-oxoheptanedioate aldolase